MSTELRHRKITAALRTLKEIFNEDETARLDVILIVCSPTGDTKVDYGSSLVDRRRALDILRDQVAHFEQQLGDAA